jgi:hypothetical protein
MGIAHASPFQKPQSALAMAGIAHASAASVAEDKMRLQRDLTAVPLFYELIMEL